MMERDRTPPDPATMDLRGEFVPDDVSPREARDEVNFRAHRAGYDVTRDGRPKPHLPTIVVAWGRRKFNVWPKDEHGNLIDD